MSAYTYDPETGIVFEQIIFQGDLLNITFSEAHDRGEGVALLRTLVVDGPNKVGPQYAEFMDALRALVDASERALRNPPDKRFAQ